MKNKILNKAVKLLAVFSIAFTSLIQFQATDVKALATNVTGDQILAQARTYETWDYNSVGTCTGLVTRTLQALGVGSSIVGNMVGNVARYSPDQMYANAMANPNDATLIWAGYTRDVPTYAHLFKDGDLVIQRASDKYPTDGFGHVGFIDMDNTGIYMYGANNPVDGIGRAVLLSYSRGQDITLDGRNWINVFRLVDDVQPAYANLTSTKDATEEVEVKITKTDVDTDKPLSDVEFDFYRDDVLFAQGVKTDANGIAKATSTQVFSATSASYRYCSNFNELSDAKKQEVINAGIYTSKAAAQAVADAEAQRLADENANQKHTYSAIETKTKTKYWLDPDNNTVNGENTGSGSVIMDLTNKRVSAEISLVKNDANEKEPTALGDATLDGAVYGLYAREDILDPADDKVLYAKDTLVFKGTTKDAKISVNNLYLGKYYWQEITPSKGYKLDPTKYDIDLDYEGQDKLIVSKNSTVYEEVITGDFDIEKVITSGDVSEEVVKEEGAEFTVVLNKYVEQYGSIEAAYEHRSEFSELEYDRIVTNKDGYAKSKKLAYGVYKVKQTKAAVDTEIYEKEWTFTVEKENQETIRYIINNRPFTSYLKLVKEDAETGKQIVLDSATFKIKNLKTNKYVTQKIGETTNDTWSTDDRGYVVLPLQLKAGDYQAEEITSPNGYLLNTTPVKFKVTNANIGEVDEEGDPIKVVTVTDKAVKGEISVAKKGEVLTGYDEENKQFVYEEKNLAGAVIRLEANKDILDPADGSVIYKAGEVIGRLTTTGDVKKDKFANLPLGSYALVEESAPTNYILDESKHVVELEYKDDKTAIISKTQTIVNERQKYEVAVGKFEDGKTEYLEGAEFTLFANRDVYNADGKIIVKEGTELETVTSTVDGKVKFTLDLPTDLASALEPMPIADEIDPEFSQPTEIDGVLLVGSPNSLFVVKETKAPYGYEEKAVNFYVDTKYTDETEAIIYNEYDFTNAPILTDIKVVKIDADSKKVITGKAFEFTLYSDAECKNVIATAKGNEDGVAFFEDLRYSTVYLKETKAPDGYTLSNEVKKIVIDENTPVKDGVYTFEFENVKKPKLVETGDSTNTSPYFIGLCLSAGLVGLLCVRKRKDGLKNE